MAGEICFSKLMTGSRMKKLSGIIAGSGDKT